MYFPIAQHLPNLLFTSMQYGVGLDSFIQTMLPLVSMVGVGAGAVGDC